MKKATVVVIVMEQKETLAQWVLQDLLGPPALLVTLTTMDRAGNLERKANKDYKDGLGLKEIRCGLVY